MATKSTAKAADAVASKNGFSLISDEKLKQIYSTMLKCRTLEEHLQSTAGLNGNSVRRSFLGQEACEVGVAIDLRQGDTIVPGQRAFLASLIKGDSLRTILSRFFGDADSREGDHSSSPGTSTSAQVKLALETAIADLKGKTNDIAVLFGEGSGSQGYWLEALAIAGKKRLPILFVLPGRRAAQTRKAVEASEPSSKIPACNFPMIPVDGNDAVAVYRVAYESITRIRQGGGPTLIDCNFGSQGLPVIGTRNGTSARNGSRDFHDPVTFMESYLTRKGLFSVQWKKKLLADFQKELRSNLASTGASRLGNSR